MNGSMRQHINRSLLTAFLSFACLTPAFAQETAPQAETAATDEQVKPSAPSVDKALLDKLERYLTGSKWTGNFTITGQENQDLTPETYEITKAKHHEGDSWLLTARIKYADKDRTVDLPPLQIKWVNDSPVIVVDKMLIPLMGVFDARVIIRNNKYAGTWSHNKVGGHLFGEIKRLNADETKPESTTDDEAKSDGNSTEDK